MKKKQGSKRVAKLHKKGSKSFAEKTEYILLTMPKIIVTQIDKDLVLLKKQLGKLKDDLRKADVRKQQLGQQQMVLQKKKTPAAKKKVNTLQKIMQKTVKLMTALKRGTELVNKQIAELSQKREKYHALQSQLSQFQKTWTKKPSKKLSRSKKDKIKSKNITLSKKQTNARPGFTQSIETIKLPLQTEVEFDQELEDQFITRSLK